MGSWMFLSEPKIKIVKKFVFFFKESVKSVIHVICDSLKNFIDIIGKLVNSFNVLNSIVFKMFGDIPDENDRLKRQTSWLDRYLIQSLRTLVGVLLYEYQGKKWHQECQQSQ